METVDRVSPNYINFDLIRLNLPFNGSFLGLVFISSRKINFGAAEILKGLESMQTVCKAWIGSLSTSWLAPMTGTGDIGPPAVLRMTLSTKPKVSLKHLQEWPTLPTPKHTLSEISFPFSEKILRLLSLGNKYVHGTYMSPTLDSLVIHALLHPAP